MLAAKSGRIVTVASTAGLIGYSYVVAYCAAKHAVVGMTRALAREIARSGVTVNAVCPGFTDTDLVGRAVDTIVAKTGRSADEARGELSRTNPQGRLIDPAEVAAAVGWICLPLLGSHHWAIDCSCRGRSDVMAGMFSRPLPQTRPRRSFR